MKPLLLTEADFANLSLLGQARLEHLLKRAIVVSSDAVPAEIITMNTEVLLCDDATGERRVVRVVYPVDADATRASFRCFSRLARRCWARRWGR